MRTFLYLHTADLIEARAFYTDLLGLDEIFFSRDDGVVGYAVGSLQLTIASQSKVAGPQEWATQLGWSGGSGSQPSWGVELSPEMFHRTVTALVDAAAETRHPDPQWVGYWSFPVKDPMGNTVELSTPERSAWPR